MENMEDIRPDFLRTTDELKAAEEQATRKKMENREDELDSAREDEENPRGFYRGTGRPIISPKKGGIKGFMKKHAPMMVITALIGGAGAMMMGLQTLMPMAIAEMIIEKFNSVGISSTETSDVWLDAQLNQATGKVTEKAGNIGQVNFAFSDYQLQSLEMQKLKVVKNGSTVLAILYPKNGTYIPVVGTEVISRGDLTGQIGALSGVSNLGAPVTPKKALEDKDFNVLYTTAAKTWRGGNSGWFDKIMSNVTETKLSVRRNRFARFVAGTVGNLDDGFKKLAESVAQNRTSDGGVEAKDRELLDGAWRAREVDDVDIEGGGDVNVTDNAVKSTDNTAGVSEALSGKALKAAGAVAGLAGGVCSLLEGVMSIYTVVSAYQSMQFLNLVSGFLESVDKVKAGDGDMSPIHEYGNNLTTVSDTTNADGIVVARKTAMEAQGMSWLFNKNDVVNANNQSVKNVNFETIMSNTSSLFGNIQLTAEVYEKCGYVRAISGIFGLTQTILSFVPIVGQGIMVAQVATGLFGLFIKTAVSAAVATAIAAIIPMATKSVVGLITKNVATEWFGEDLGNAMVSGANKYLGGNGTSAGQSPGSRAKVLAYLGVQDSVIAREAEYQRSVRSPFDVNSKYTFMGSLARTMLPMAYASGGITSAMKGVSGLTSSAIIAMLPTASAIDEQDFLTSNGKCDLLANVGAEGDAFCNAYEITDVSTLYDDPTQAYKNAYYYKGYYLHSYWWTDSNGVEHYEDHKKEDIYSPRFDADGNVITPSCGNYGGGACVNFDNDGNMIKISYPEEGYEYYSYNLSEGGKVEKEKTSNLAKYLTYCGQRTAQYGIKDATIADNLLGSNTTTSRIIGYIPGLNDVQDIVQGMREEGNLAWITGKACVASDENEYWAENKYYQRYGENQRLLENIEPGYKSAVTAYVEEYWEENPLDDSFEGQLARFSGMSVEQVGDTLALIEYYEFLNEYDASKRVAFGVEEVLVEDTIWFENDAVIASVGVVEMANNGSGGGFSYTKRPYNIWFGEIWYGNAEKRQTVA